MSHGTYTVPPPENEPVLPYSPGTSQRASLKAELQKQSQEQVEIPCVVGGEEIRTGDLRDVVMPHRHSHVLGRMHRAGTREVERAIEAATAARHDWERASFEDRAAVILKAAELLATTWRDRVNASTMLGQSKTPHQSEIDAACELIDFWRFNPSYAERLYREQPRSADRSWNRSEHRPLDGFVLAVTPFNFTSIAANLPTAPALMGNTVLWKPSETQTLSAWHTFQLLREAGLPDGVINFLPGDGPTVGGAALSDRRLGGIHFTGSTTTFQHLWKSVGQNIERYGQYPRLVGETGGKDFIVVHPSASREAVVTAIVRGGFEFQGQKCSAASRCYVPKSWWADLKDRLAQEIGEIRVGDVTDFRTFMGAVIDDRAFAKHAGAIDAVKHAGNAAEIAIGGECDDSDGWFVQPTVIQAHDPHYDTMERELFGPIVSIFVYDDSKWEETLDLVDESSPYGLTGAVFARDRRAVRQAFERLRFAAGNFYVNDKPTGAVVSQQPFGGARASGTNDKAGSILNLLRWVSPRSIKENFVPATDWRYPYMAGDEDGLPS